MQINHDKLPLKYVIGTYKRSSAYPENEYDVLYDMVLWSNLQTKLPTSKYKEMPMKSLHMMYKSTAPEQLNVYLLALATAGYINIVLDKKVIQLVSNPWM